MFKKSNQENTQLRNMGTFTIMAIMTLLSLILLFLSVCHAIETSYFLIDDDFSDIYCPALDAGLGITESLGVCGHRCSRNAECLGFFYIPTTRACNPRLEEVTNSSDCHTENGSRYYFNTVHPKKSPCLTGSGCQVIDGILYATGCLGQISDCQYKLAGDYQSCAGCNYYMTCAPSGVFTRPCPANLLWDDNLKTCSFISSTCGSV